MKWIRKILEKFHKTGNYIKAKEAKKAFKNGEFI
jgi:hypothetical protein